MIWDKSKSNYATNRLKPESAMRAHHTIAAFLGLLLLMAGTVNHAPAADDPAAVEFFEKKIGPVLVESCYECHSASPGRGVRSSFRPCRGWIISVGRFPTADAVG